MSICLSGLEVYLFMYRFIELHPPSYMIIAHKRGNYKVALYELALLIDR